VWYTGSWSHPGRFPGFPTHPPPRQAYTYLAGLLFEATQPATVSVTSCDIQLVLLLAEKTQGKHYPLPRGENTGFCGMDPLCMKVLSHGELGEAPTPSTSPILQWWACLSLCGGGVMPSGNMGGRRNQKGIGELEAGKEMCNERWL
jgi:hypothetical protein